MWDTVICQTHIFFASGGQESNQANDFSLRHTKGPQVLTILANGGGEGYAGNWQQSRNKSLTPLRYFPCYESSTTRKQRPVVRNVEEEWQPALSNSKSRWPPFFSGTAAARGVTLQQRAKRKGTLCLLVVGAEIRGEDSQRRVCEANNDRGTESVTSQDERQVSDLLVFWELRSNEKCNCGAHNFPLNAIVQGQHRSLPREFRTLTFRGYFLLLLPNYLPRKYCNRRKAITSIALSTGS